MPPHLPQAAPAGALKHWVRNNAILSVALGVSVALHAALLTIRFVAPETFNLKAEDPGLEVVLVNTRSERAPTKADVLAQVALEGGGDHERGQATSPLPNLGIDVQGESLTETRRRLEQLEQEQRKLLAAVRKTRSSIQTTERKNPQEAALDPSAADLDDSARAFMRQAAIIDARIEEENKRPRKHFFGTSAKDYSAAMYVDAFRHKVERWGNQHYPIEVKGKFYGQVQVTIVLDKDGRVHTLELNRSSGNKVLDAAALNIIRRSAPFGRFTSQMSAEMDLLSITRTLIFTNDAFETRSR